MTTEQTAKPRAKRSGRSPSYPGIDLKEALERSHTLYRIEGKYSASVETILAHWGYKPKSGPGLVTIAALKKFGLLIDEGSGRSRKARLSDNAIRIALDTRPETGERYKALQNAALTPTIHRELWNSYGDSLPSDANLRYELVTERGFTEAGADEFIPQYKRTLAFAHLLNGGKLSVAEEDKPGEESEGQMSPPTTLQEPPAKPPTTRQTRVIQLPISSTEWAALQAPFPLTEEKWKQMLAVLDAMKPALVGNDEGSESQEQPDETSG